MSSKNETTSNAPTENDAMRIKFIFANRDGVTAEIDCSPSDTIGAVTENLRSKWPTDITETAPSADRIRLICMGKGVLAPASKTLEECEVPVFLTHPTPVNVSVKPIVANQKKSSGSGGISLDQRGGPPPGDCCCVIS